MPRDAKKRIRELRSQVKNEIILNCHYLKLFPLRVNYEVARVMKYVEYIDSETDTVYLSDYSFVTCKRSISRENFLVQVRVFYCGKEYDYTAPLINKLKIKIYTAITFFILGFVFGSTDLMKNVTKYITLFFSKNLEM